MCTDLITHHLRLRNVWVINYLDDYIGVAYPQNAPNAFQILMNLLQKVGLPINDKKIEEPGERITCLGIEINARTGILKIPPNKMAVRGSKWALPTCPWAYLYRSYPTSGLGSHLY